MAYATLDGFADEALDGGCCLLLLFTLVRIVYLGKHRLRNTVQNVIRHCPESK